MPLRSHLRTLAKTISWRLVAGVDTFAVAIASIYFTGTGDMTHAMTAAVGVVGLEAISKLGWFYLHERIWETAIA